MKGLTKKQKQILQFIEQSLSKNMRPPTIAEIKKHFNFVSNQSVVDHINALLKKGYVEKVGKSRGVIPVKKQPLFPILGQVAAGNPLDAIETNSEGSFVIDDYMKDPENTYVLQVKGDSMKDVGIMDRDYVFVHYQPTIKSGEIGVAVVDEEATVKRIIIDDGKYILHPANPDFSPIEIAGNDENFRIAGKVIGVFRSL
jgi:repressor LexA